MSIEELYKVLKSNNVYSEFLKNEDEIFEMIPELNFSKGFDQNNEWHVYDVYHHTLHVIGNVPNRLYLRLAALFHDLGKPYTYKEDKDGVGHFHGHYKKSQEIFEKFADKYNVDLATRNVVSKIIYYHDINVSKLTEEEKDSLCKVLDKEEIEMLYEFKRADLKAQNEKFLYVLDRLDEEEKELLERFSSKTHFR